MLFRSMNDDGIRQPAVKIADALGSLTIAEAERLRKLVVASNDPAATPSLDDDGIWQVHTFAMAAAS